MILACAMVLTSLTACGGGGSSSSAAPPNSTSLPTADGTQTSVVRDSVNVGVQSDPADFAPWAANSNGRTNALWGIYQELGHILSLIHI